MWIPAIMGIFMGVYEIRYAYKFVEKELKGLRRFFITLGLLTIMLGSYLLVIS